MEGSEYCPDCGVFLPEVRPAGLCPGCTFHSLFGEEEVDEKHPDSPVISGLVVHEEVGEGGFGIVYRATQTEVIRRRVALKVLKAGVDTRRVLRRFEIERQALALLEHENIVRIYEAGETSEGYPWFTMEFVEGTPINEALAGQDDFSKLEVFLKVCDAVSFAHEKGVLHRDLKPTNILVTPDGVPKVIDFGIAKSLDLDVTPGMASHTSAREWLGTPVYAAPEQADPHGAGVEPDERADVFSLGAILYQLVSGKAPATGQGKLSPPSAIASKRVSRGLDMVVMKALADDRKARYESVADLAADLGRLRNGERLVLEKRRPLILAAVSISFLVLLMGWFLWKKEINHFSHAEPEINLNFENSGHRELDDRDPRIEPFRFTTTVDFFCFHDEGDETEFVFGFDSSWYSSARGEFFAGARGPDLPGVYHVAVGSDDEGKLLAILEREREEVIGRDEAARIEEMEWDPHLADEEDSAQFRKRKRFLESYLSLKRLRVAAAEFPNSHLSPISHQSSGVGKEISFSRSGDRALALFEGGEALLVDSKSRALIGRLDNAESQVCAGGVSLDGETMVLGMSNGRVQVLSAFDGLKILSDFQAISDGGAVEQVGIFDESRSGEPVIWTISSDEKLRVWDRSGKLQWTQALPESAGAMISYKGSSKVVMAGQDGSVFLIDLEKRKLVFSPIKNQASRSTVFLSKDSRFFACGSFDGEVLFWDLDANEAKKFSVSDRCTAVALSPNGRVLAIVEQEGKVSVWEIESGEKRDEFEHRTTINSLVFSPDGEILITVGQDKKIRFREWPRGEFARPTIISMDVPRKIYLESSFESRVVLFILGEGGNLEMQSFPDGLKVAATKVE